MMRPPSSTDKASDLIKSEELPFLDSYIIKLKEQNTCVLLSVLMCNTLSLLEDFFLQGL